MDIVKENDKLIITKRKYENEITSEFATMFKSSKSLSSIFINLIRKRKVWDSAHSLRVQKRKNHEIGEDDKVSVESLRLKEKIDQDQKIIRDFNDQIKKNLTRIGSWF